MSDTEREREGERVRMRVRLKVREEERVSAKDGKVWGEIEGDIGSQYERIRMGVLELFWS